jgi:hypothetical protein
MCPSSGFEKMGQAHTIEKLGRFAYKPLIYIYLYIYINIDLLFNLSSLKINLGDIQIGFERTQWVLLALIHLFATFLIIFEENHDALFVQVYALLMHFLCTSYALFMHFLCTFYALFMHFHKVHRKCIRSASKVHNMCKKSTLKMQKSIKNA